MTRQRGGAIPDAPADLSDESSALWDGLARDVKATMGGAAIDYVVLHDLLRARDRLAEVRRVLASEGLVVPGSKGQSRGHPLLTVESTLRREVSSALKALRLDGTERFRFDVGSDGRLKDSY